jgi:hypothetical protein
MYIIPKYFRREPRAYTCDGGQRIQRELGDVFMALKMLTQSEDLSYSFIMNRTYQKRKSIKQWLHHQAAHPAPEESKAATEERSK